jgi:hypothetical protein
VTKEFECGIKGWIIYMPGSRCNFDLHDFNQHQRRDFDFDHWVLCERLTLANGSRRQGFIDAYDQHPGLLSGQPEKISRLKIAFGI